VEALDELDRRYLEGDGAPDRSVLEPPLALNRALSAGDVDAAMAVISPDIVAHHHMELSWPTQDFDMMKERIESLFETGPDRKSVFSAVLALRGDVIAYVRTMFAAGVEGFEPQRHTIEVVRVVDGKLAVDHSYAEHQLEDAMARFEELAGQALDHQLVNSATRASAGLTAALHDQDLAAAAGFLAPGIRRVDRRHTVSSPEIRGAEAQLESLAHSFEVGFTSFGLRVLAVRGDRLELSSIDTRTDSGAISDRLMVTEVDADGLITTAISFDHDDLLSAVEELNRRYLEGEGAAHAECLAPVFALTRPFAERDPVGFRTSVSEDFLWRDHRSLRGYELDRDAVLSWMLDEDSITGVRVGYTSRIDAVSGDWSLHCNVRRGLSPEGLEYETSFLLIHGVRDGQLFRVESFDDDDLDRARERLSELAGGESDRAPSKSPFLALADCLIECLNSGDLEGFRDLVTEDVVRHDHLPLSVQGEQHGIEAFIGLQRAALDTGQKLSASHELVALRGDQFGLTKVSLKTEFGEEDHLVISELSPEGLLAAYYNYELQDLPTAIEQLDGLFLNSLPPELADVFGPTVAAQHAANRLDLDALAGLLDPGFEVVDHRPASWPPLDREGMLERTGSVEGTGYVTVISEVIELSASALLVRLDRVTVSPDTRIVTWVVAQASGGRVTHIDNFDEDQFDLAETFYQELVATASGTMPSADRDNRASLVAREIFPRIVGEVGEIAAFLHPNVIRWDNRSGAPSPTAYSAEAFLAGLESWSHVGVEDIQVRNVATHSDHLCTVRVNTAMRNGYEIEALSVVEVDEDNLATRFSHFDDDDLPAALELMDAWSGENRAVLAGRRLIAATINGDPDEPGDYPLHPEVVRWDYRQGISSPLAQTATAYAESLDSYKALGIKDADYKVPGSRGDAIAVVEVDVVSREDFRFHALLLCEVDEQDLITKVAMFDVEDLHEALGLMDEWHDELIRSGEPSVIDGSVATGEPVTGVPVSNLASERWQEMSRLYNEGRIEEMRQFLYGDVVRNDRRAVSVYGTVDGADDVFALQRSAHELGRTEVAAAVLAVRGQHLCLVETRLAASLGHDVALAVLMTTEDGSKVLSYSVYDSHDLASALKELDELYLASIDPERADVYRPFIAASFSTMDGDYDQIRQFLADDFVSVDHRTLAWPDLDREGFIDRIRSQEGSGYSLVYREIHRLSASVGLGTADHRTASPETHRTNHHVWVSRNGRLVRVEHFDDSDFTSALVRFEELASSSIADSGAPRGTGSDPDSQLASVDGVGLRSSGA
ncbi:MAG: hypothetical protein ACR2PK_09470, partial [Acidimicrobiales bacterium]